MRVSQRMTRNPITIDPKSNHREAVELMRAHKIRRLPVVNAKGKLIGIITRTDVLSTSPSPATTLSVYEIYSLLENLRVEQFMSTPVLAVSDTCSLAEAARFMVERKVSALPVVEGDRLVGIITETDIFRAFVEVLGGGTSGTQFDVRTLDRRGALADITRATADAGGNILSLTTFHTDDTDHALISIKERGADATALQHALNNISELEIVEFIPNNSSDRLLEFA